MKRLTQSEVELDPSCYAQVNKWLARGDGIAVYENQDMCSPDLGHRKFVSYGSKAAMLEVSADAVPTRLPDIGHVINWRYILVGVYSGPLFGPGDESYSQAVATETPL